MYSYVHLEFVILSFPLFFIRLCCFPLKVSNIILLSLFVLSEIRYPDEEAGQIPMAFIVRKPESNITAAQVMDFIAKQVCSLSILFLFWLCTVLLEALQALSSRLSGATCPRHA